MVIKKGFFSFLLSFAWVSFFWSEPVQYGARVALVNEKTGLYLASGRFPFELVAQPGSDDVIFRNQVFTVPECAFDSLWTVKKDHSGESRWGFAEPEVVKNNSLVRLESAITAGNFFVDFQDGLARPKTQQILRLGAGNGSDLDNLKLEVVKVGAKEVGQDSPVDDQGPVLIKFTPKVNEHWVLMVDPEKNVLYSKAQKDCKADELVRANWTLRVVQPNYFTYSFLKPAQAQLAAFDKNSKIKTVVSGGVGQVSALDAKELKGKVKAFNYATVRLPDQNGFVGRSTDQAVTNNKCTTRFLQICYASSTLAWAVSDKRRLVKIVLSDGQIVSEVEFQKALVDQVACSPEDVFLRVGSEVFQLLEHNSETKEAKVGTESVVKDVLFFCASADRTLFYIDSKYSVYKKPFGKGPEKVFEYQRNNFPPFVSISVSSDGKKLLLIDADGKLFLSKELFEGFWFTGLEFCTSAAVLDDRVIVSVQAVFGLGGPCFSIPLEGLVEQNQEMFYQKAQIKDLDLFVQTIKYYHSLAYKSVELTNQLVAWIDKKISEFSKQKGTKPAKDFQLYFSNTFAPVARLLSVSGATKTALERIVNFFADTVTSEGDLRSRITTLEAENKMLKESLKKASALIKNKK